MVGKYLIFDYLYLTNLILYVDDIVSAFLWKLWLLNIEFVVEDVQIC